ncbi:MAG: glycosyltransferase family 39 protein [Acidimicrobiales bacterium]
MMALRQRPTPSGAWYLTPFCVLVPAGLAAGLCGYELSDRSIWLDESATISIASQHGSALFAAMRHDGGNMMAYYALIHGLISVFGTSTLVLRLPSVVAAALTAAVVSLIGQWLFDRRIGLAAGLISAVSLPLVYWGQDARAYALMFAFGATSYLGFIGLIDGESRTGEGRPPRWAWPLYVVSLVLATYMSFVALLIVPAQLGSLYWYRRRFRSLLGALVVAAVCCAPLLPLAHQRGAGQLFWVPRPGWGLVAAVLEALASSALAPNFKLSASSLPLLALTAVLLVAIAVMVVKWLRSHPAETGVSRERWIGAMLVGWLVVPTALDFLESVVGQSVFESRYLLISAPALGLVLAWGLLSAPLPRFAGPLAIAVLLLLRGLQILPTYGVSPENWRAASRYVLDRSVPGDCIAFYPSDGRMAFEYYLDESRHPPGSVPRPVLPSLSFHDVKPFVEAYASLSEARVAEVHRTCPHLWLVSSHIGMPTDSPQSRVHYYRYRALLARLGRAYPNQVWAHFGYASLINVGLFERAGSTSLESATSIRATPRPAAFRA